MIKEEKDKMDKILVRTLAFSMKDANDLFSIEDEGEIKSYLSKLNSVDEMERLLSMIFNVLKSDMPCSAVLMWLNLFVSVKTITILSSPVIQNILRQIVIYHETTKYPSQLINETLIKMKRLDCISQNKKMNDIEEDDEDEDLKLFVDDSDFELTDEDSDTMNRLNDDSSAEMDVKSADQTMYDSENDDGRFSDELQLDGESEEADEDDDDDDDDDEISMDSEDMDGL